MAHFLRGKQAGIQTDFSARLVPELFAIDTVSRYGICSQTSALAYDPVQSLLAIGTSESPQSGGQIYVFGQKRVCATFALSRKASVRTLRFCADKLISVDSKNEVAIFSLETQRRLTSYSPPGVVTALLTDPALDHAFVGLQNGDVIAYDLDRQMVAPFKIPNFWRERDPRARVLPLLTLCLHPRDVGTLLLGYSEGAVIYSFKQNKATKFFHYELQPGDLGGDSDPSSANAVRRPRMTQAIWHPTGTFILTAHEDSSFVIWDPKTGQKITSRTLEDSEEHRGSVTGSTPGTFPLKSPIFRIAWCSKANPDDTGILVAGGTSTTMPTKGLTFLDLGPTPVYATTSWQMLSAHFQNPKRQHILPTPPGAEVIDFCLIPRRSPHYAGSCDPIAVLALTNFGEISTLSFPSGHPVTPTNQLHISLTFVHPFVNHIALASVERTRWLGMTEKRSHGPPILLGGAEATHSMKRYERRGVLNTAHADGTIRFWDVGDGDEIENEDLLQIDVARALGRFQDVEVSQVSMSGATGEVAVGLKTGEVAVFRWGHNQNFGREMADSPAEAFGLQSIKGRAEPSLKEGLLPLTLLDQQQGPVTALKVSDVGFVAIGFEGGRIAVIDLRGPALISSVELNDFASEGKRSSRRRSAGNAQGRPDWPTVLEFGVMNLESEDYSSILLYVGTNAGRLLTFKLLPESHGGYSVKFVGSTSLDDRIISISPISADLGVPASATQSAVANLRNGFKVNGVLLAVTRSGVKIFKPPGAKGASKSWDDFLCDSCCVARFEDHDYALVGLFGDGRARAYSIPGLKEIASADVGHIIDVKRFPEAIVTPTGNIIGWTGPSETAVLNVWGTGKDLTKSQDRLFNPEAIIPPRPTISNVQWISGTQYVTPADMATLIGGPDRPPSKRMIEQMRMEEQQQRLAGRSTPSGSSINAGQDEGYWAYMQRQVQERTERLNIIGDSMDSLEENSSNWVSDANKFVKDQKRKAVMGVISSKLGL